jgi:phosphoribosylformimino-5-aminoimidazole carboxamide ribotide isomerase
MQLLPVLDLKDGHVVRGVAGRRDEYRPVTSSLTRSTLPAEVARALHDRFGFAEFYLADLNAIGGAPPAWRAIEALHAEGYRLWVDRGIRTVADATAIAGMSVASVVVGLETIESPESLDATCSALGPTRVVFSLDLKGGEPLGDLARWGEPTAWVVAQRALAAGVSRMLVLDLARVGVGSGVGTEDLCRKLRDAWPNLELTAGGGVRSADDVRRLDQCGVNYVLVASALHDGRISPQDLAALQSA